MSAAAIVQEGARWAATVALLGLIASASWAVALGALALSGNL